MRRSPSSNHSSLGQSHDHHPVRSPSRVHLRWRCDRFLGRHFLFPRPFRESFPLTSPPSASTPPSTQLLLDLFSARGWCPYISRQICRTFNYAVVYYVTQLPNPSRVTHDECTEQACVGNNVDMINYTTRHAIPDCKCQHDSIPLQDMRDIIRTGGVPLVLVHETADHSVQLRVTRMTHRTPFVAFSHDWSDGLGNPSANSL